LDHGVDAIDHGVNAFVDALGIAIPPSLDGGRAFRVTSRVAHPKSRNVRDAGADGMGMNHRALVEALAAPLRLQLPPESGALLDALVMLATSATDPSRGDPATAPGVVRAELGVGSRSPVPPEPGLAAILGATDWDQLSVTVLDGHTVRVGSAKRSVRRTYRDLGLHSAKSREPTRKWDILVAICEGHGEFRWRDFGDFPRVNQAVYVLRCKLRAAFGLESDPFEWNRGWRARFFARSELGR
jgi:hypothetical protein